MCICWANILKSSHHNSLQQGLKVQPSMDFHMSILKEWAGRKGTASHNPGVFCFFFLIAAGFMPRHFTAVSTEQIFHHTLSVCHHHFPMYFRIIQSITGAVSLLTWDSACNAQINSNVKNPHWEAGGRSASHTVPSLL